MTIQEIKTRLAIGRVLAHYGLKADANGMLRCPFHEDQKPSMRVYEETDTVYCFAGGCKVKSLDAIDFIMQMDGSSKREAILKAKTLCSQEPHTPPETQPQPMSNPASDFQTYLEAIKRNQNAQDYCESRTLDWQTLEIGYKSRRNAGQSASAKATADTWGRGCIIFPLKNENGEVVSLYGRSIVGPGPTSAKAMAGKHYYQSGRKGLYPGYPSADTRRLILAESVIDAAGILPYTTEGVLALYGTNGLTAEHLEAIKQWADGPPSHKATAGEKEIILALDADQAGREATQRHANTLNQVLSGVKITTLELPEGEDLNSLIVSHEDRAGLLASLLEQRRELKEEAKPATAVPQFNTANPNNLVYTTALATYFVKGGVRCAERDFEHMKITLVVEAKEGVTLPSQGLRRSRQKLDLYEDRQVEKASREAGEKLGLRPDLIELDLQMLTDQLEAWREQLAQASPETPARVQVPAGQRQNCLDFLQKPDLTGRLNKLIGQAGIVGERTNRLLLFVVASSYKMPDTLHALIQGASGSGKTRLLKVISELMPPEDVKRYTRVTDGSFYNQGEYYFRNKLLCFEDIDGLKEEALLAVRELQSNEILITSTSIKDEQGGIRGGERVVRGPIASISCTTRAEVYEDNISRCFTVAVDESQEQNLRVIRYQNDRSAGVIDAGKEQEARTFLQNCMRLLQPLEVVNPYANRITLPQEAHKIRRLNELYQSFVRQVTLLNQYQRKCDERGRLLSQPGDLLAACEILFESIVLKVDELDGSLRQFFEKLKDYVRAKGNADYEFNRFEVRSIAGVSKTQQHRYITQLLELEYLRQWGYPNRGFRYRIAHWDDVQGLRKRIKEELEKQLKELKMERQGTPQERQSEA